MNRALELSKLIEAVLFYRGEPMSREGLAHTLQATSEEIHEALELLSRALADRGLSLVEDHHQVALGTAPEARTSIEALRREELEGPLGKAGLETLAIVMYAQPVSRSDIEYVRGVNSSSILRSLTMRGLIQKKEHPGKRGFVYETTPELPAALGLSALSQMPDFEALRSEIESVTKGKENPV